MVAKYFVWGSGAWRELDVSTGAVRGWRRRARFVFVRRGRLQLARRRPVLRALAALARDQPSAAADGPRLAHLREQSSRRLQPIAAPARAPVPAPATAPAPAPAAPVHHCCAHYNGCMSSHTSVSVQREAGVQCGAGGASVRVGGGVTLTLVRPAHSSGEEFATPRPRPGPRRSKSRSAQLHADTTDIFRPPPVKDVSEPKKRTEKKTVASATDSDSRPRAKRRRVSSGSAATEAEECKELVVSEADLAALRGFVARSRRAALERFDADEHYRRALCYAINPLVTLPRCHQLERLQRRRARTHAHNDVDADKENKAVPAASGSGEASRKPRPHATRRDKLRRSMRVRTDAESERDASPTKALPKPPSPMKAPPIPGSPIKAPLKSSSPKKAPPKSGSPKKAPPKKAVSPPRAPATKPSSPVKGAGKAAGAHAAISNRPSAARSKEYSSLEDHCIVSWLTNGARATQVNGNRLWQELQPEYPRLTGQERSWHSLRNRYLRYILPSLGALGLPPPDVSRLRAAAATGCMKRVSRAGPVRRASIFRQEAVRSASGRRPRAPDTPGPPAPEPEPVAAAKDKQGDKTESITSRLTRSSRGPVPDSPQPSTSRDAAGRRSPPRSRPAVSAVSRVSRVSRVSAANMTESASSSSSSSDEHAPLVVKDSKERRSPPRRSRPGVSRVSPVSAVSRVSAANSPESASSSSSSSDEDAPLASKDNSPARRGRARPPGRRQSSRSPSSSSEQETSDTDAAAAAERRRSLRYSEVTRRFAARHRPGSGSPGPRPARPAPDRSRSSDDFEPDRPTRSRRLFNPNAKL